MSKISLIVLVLGISLNSLASEDFEKAKSECTPLFEQRILATYEGTNAESVRMSRRVNYHQTPARRKNHILIDIEANFLVKWPENRTEARDLAGGKFLFDTKTQECRPISISEFSRLRR
jgi:hypothetical protein